MKSCPIWPGHPMTALWAIPDPAKAEGTDAELHLAFADAYRMLNNRISLFINLPMDTLDHLALQHHLDEIGRDDEAELDQRQWPGWDSADNGWRVAVSSRHANS